MATKKTTATTKKSTKTAAKKVSKKGKKSAGEAGFELSSLVTADKVLDFVKGKVTGIAEMYGGKIAGWATSQVLDLIGLKEEEGPSQLDEIQDTLEEIKSSQAELIKGLGNILNEIKFRALLTEKFQPQLRIVSRYDELIEIISMDEDERDEAIATFVKGTLDSNLGVTVDLQAIHNILCEDESGEEEPLITLFMKRWLEVAQKKELEPNYPVTSYSERANEWLLSIFLLQYMGLCQAANAMLHKNQHTKLKNLVNRTIKNMEEQKKMLDLFIPQWTLDMACLADGHTFLIPDEKDNTLFANPGSSTDVSKPASWRQRMKNNADEEWVFIPTDDTYDTFNLRTRTADYRLSPGTYSSVLQPPGKKNYKLRLVMETSTDKELLKKIEAKKLPPSDKIFPALAVIGLPEKDLAKSYLGASYKNGVVAYNLTEKKNALPIDLTDTKYYGNSANGAEISKLTTLKLENGPLYFFQGYRYLEYDQAANTATERKLISNLFPEMPFPWFSAVVPVSAQKVYFFYESHCLLWNVKTNKPDAGYPKLIREEFPQILFDHIDTVIALSDGIYAFCEREEVIFYDLAKRKATSSVLPIKDALPELPFFRIETGFNADGQAFLFHRGEAVALKLPRAKTPKPLTAEPLSKLFPALTFPVFHKSSKEALLDANTFKAVAEAPAKTYHDVYKPADLPFGGSLDVGVSAENRTDWRFTCTSHNDKDGSSRRDPIERMGRSGIFFHAESNWAGTTGPDGWAVYTAEHDASITFRLAWNSNYFKISDDRFRIEDIKGCKVDPWRYSPIPNRKIGGKHLKITISV